MNEYMPEEGNLRFDFTHCGIPIKFDAKEKTCHGLKAVDFLVDKKEYLLFIEVKDYQNPNAPSMQRDNDYRMLLEAIDYKEKSVFVLEMGMKIKDSLLRLYAEGQPFTKEVVYLLFINFDRLPQRSRRMLLNRIGGCVPTGLREDRFTSFSKIKFDIVDVTGLSEYGIACEAIA
jgi:hypothetical protein